MRKVGSGLLLAGLVGALLLVLSYRQEIADRFAVWSYEPTSEVAQLAERGGFSDEGEFYFYVTKPELVGADEFNQRCQRAERSSPILGCYSVGADRIHIYNIQDPKLDGIREVTAAHEMLHAVFARLSDRQIDRLEGQLEAVYEQVKTPRLEERMDYYARTEPGARVNELHSIIPTEFHDIGAELEEYYSQYFDDRQKIVDLHDSYSQTFEAIGSEATQLTQSLEARSRDISQMRSSYEADLAALNQQIAQFNQRAASGGFSSRQAFEQERAALISRSNSLNVRQNQLGQAIDAYNRDVERLNSLGVQMQQLNRSIDSLGAVE